MTDPTKVLFTIDVEMVQEYHRLNYDRSLSELEMQRVEDAFFAIDPGDLIENAIAIAMDGGTPNSREADRAQHGD